MPETVTHNADFSTSSMGAILRRCREYHGISLEEAADATKIGINYLKALECDKIKEFPSLAYLKGFLRIYATYLGLNSDDIIRICEKQYLPAGVPKTAKSGEVGNEPVRRRFAWQKLVLPLFLLIMLLATATFLNRSSAPSRQQTPPRPAAVTMPASAVLPARSSAHPISTERRPKPASTPTEPPAVETVQSERSSVQKPPPETAKGFIVRMKVVQNGTLAVTIDGAAVQNYDLTVGDFIEWKAEKNITLDMSNAGGIEAELNGKPLKPFGPAGKPAYVVLDADGVKP